MCMLHTTQTVRDQYPDEKYNISIQSIKFCSDASCAIGINFRERLGDWLFSLQGGNDKKVISAHTTLT